MPNGEESNENKSKKYVERKGEKEKKERIDIWSEIEGDEDLNTSRVKEQ